jgi:tetratricopeptide (TPR) repeat protein
VIALDPKAAYPYNNLGIVYTEQKHYDEAIAAHQQAIELDPDNDWSFYLRALTYGKLNHPDLAHTDFQQAISLAQIEYEKDPTDWRNTFNLALYHLTAGNQQDSDRLYQSGLNAPSEWREEAIQDLTDFLNLFPDHQPVQQMQALLQSSSE